MRAAVVLALILVLACASPVLADDRSPAQRQTLTELAYLLGQSHALRQACDGAADQYWRSWMGRLIETEAPDDTFDRRLRDSFNTGYAAAQAQYPACSDRSRAEAARLAGRGAALSRRAGGL